MLTVGQWMFILSSDCEEDLHCFSHRVRAVIVYAAQDLVWVVMRCKMLTFFVQPCTLLLIGYYCYYTDVVLECEIWFTLCSVNSRAVKCIHLYVGTLCELVMIVWEIDNTLAESLSLRQSGDSVAIFTTAYLWRRAIMRDVTAGCGSNTWQPWASCLHHRIWTDDGVVWPTCAVYTYARLCAVRWIVVSSFCNAR